MCTSLSRHVSKIKAKNWKLKKSPYTLNRNHVHAHAFIETFLRILFILYTLYTDTHNCDYVPQVVKKYC